MTYVGAIGWFLLGGGCVLLGDWLFKQHWEPKQPRRAVSHKLLRAGVILLAIVLFMGGTVLGTQGWDLVDKATQQREIIAGVADECRALQSTLADAASSGQSAKPAATVMMAVALSSRAFVGTEHAELRQLTRDLATSLADYNDRVSHLNVRGSFGPAPVGIPGSAVQSLELLGALGRLLAERYGEVC